MKTLKSQKDKLDAEFSIMAWFRQENKPATAQSLVDALQSKFSKPVVQKALEQLSEQGKVDFKDFKKVRLFFSKAHKVSTSPCDTSKASEALYEACESIQTNVNQLLISHESLTAKLAFLTSVPSSESLTKRHSELEGSICLLTARVEALNQGPTQDVCPKAACLTARNYITEWQFRRHLTQNLLSHANFSDLGIVDDAISVNTCINSLPKVGS